MNPQTVKAGSNMKIVLNPDNKALDEVIVVAYGTAKEKCLYRFCCCHEDRR